MNNQTTDIQENYTGNRGMGDSFLEEAYKLLLPFFGPCTEASVHQDTKMNTDIVSEDGVSIGLRIRTPQYEQFADELTIRSKHPKSKQCELDKLKQGYGDFTLYGFADEERGIYSWQLIDLAVLRKLMEGKIFPQKTNRDKIKFITIPLERLARTNPELIVASSKDDNENRK